MARSLILFAAVLLTGSSAYAANVHVDALPSVDASFSKETSDYLYLEGETVTQGASDVFVNALDADRTFYRTSANPSDFWGSGPVYDGARYAARGGNTDFTNINSYWEDLDTGLSNGSYDVFVRAYANPGGTQTFSMFVGSDRASVDNGTAFGTVVTPTDGIARWYKIGSVELTTGMDTFRLRIDTTNSTVRFDTVLFAAVPEPASFALFAAGGLLVTRRRRR